MRLFTSVTGLIMLSLSSMAFPIPDANFRAWINANCPGAMTGNDLDTEHPAVLGLTVMDVSNSGIQNLSGAWAFSNVTNFNASNNPLTLAGLQIPPGTISAYISDCLLAGNLVLDNFVGENLSTLHLPNNQLTSVTWCTNGCTLQGLYVQNNAITSFSGQVPFTLQTLDASFNQLSVPPTIAVMRYLDLSHNQLTTPPNTAAGVFLASLLNLSNNLLTALPSQLCTYASVDLSGNLIGSIGNLFTCNTTTLYLADNPLAQGIVQLPRSLVYADLRNTQLTCLPYLPWTLTTLLSTGNSFTCLPNLPNGLNTAIAQLGIAPTVCGLNTPCYIPPPQLRLRMGLQGAWDVNAGLMRDNLRAQGLLPTTEPYTALGYTYLNNAAPLSVDPALFTTTGPRAIVDWVIVEFRQSNAMPGILRASMPALVRRDGWLVSTTGDTLLTLNLDRTNYRVAVKHRNHLGGITFQTPSFMNGPTVCDMLTNSALTNQFAFVVVPGTGILMVQGDVNMDKIVVYTGQNNDRDLILQAVGGTIPTATLNGVYRREDLNLDGTVKYTGQGNDRDLILQAVGGSIPTNTRSQLPVY